MCSPAPWEAGAGQARLAQLSRGGMTTLVLTNGERAEEGPKAQKIGLKEQARPLVGRISDGVVMRLRWE
jgi:hypothetical protein